MNCDAPWSIKSSEAADTPSPLREYLNRHSSRHGRPTCMLACESWMTQPSGPWSGPKWTGFPNQPSECNAGSEPSPDPRRTTSRQPIFWIRSLKVQTHDPPRLAGRKQRLRGAMGLSCGREIRMIWGCGFRTTNPIQHLPRLQPRLQPNGLVVVSRSGSSCDRQPLATIS